MPPVTIEKTLHLKAFFAKVKEQEFFEVNHNAYYRKLREQIKSEIFTLLTENRNFLADTIGLDWIYDELIKCEPFFTFMRLNGDTKLIRDQSYLFLSLLPFPNQWERLQNAEEELSNNSEVKNLVVEEKKKIQAKLSKKRQKKFKLHHFCQILKKPRPPLEKGILRIFSLPYFFANESLLKELNKEYFLYIEPPWGVLARHYWLRVFSTLDDPCLFGVGGHEDTLFLQTQHNIITTNLAHGDFLQETEPVLLDQEKSYDIVFNALYDDMPRKRHDLLLDVLAQPFLKKINALFLGRGEPHNVNKLIQKVHERGLERRVTVISNIKRKKVPELLACCRIGVQISAHENACRSIYEYLRSNLPCVVTESMAGLNFDIINTQTGRVANDNNLPNTIMHVLNNIDKYRPRRWFLENSGSTNSTRILNKQFKEIFSRLGYQWSEDIVPLDSSGANRYRTAKQFKTFHSDFNALYQVFKKHASMKINLVKD